MRKNSVKSSRVNSEVQREIAELIRSEIKDPRISPMTSVTKVDVTTDLKYCKVYISVFGDESSKDDTLAGLKKASGFIRSQLAKRINLRNTPELTFIYDDSMEYGMYMSNLIDKVASEDAKAHKDNGENSD
ncbi:MAG: 30S ribosome-binding factor RbfA [Lachnospiraceae bacterium]|jgi:ribosome-binding factor A|nr:30S ribosome-binding factor RbfA [Lachnospiraceae bacterium]